MRACSPASLSTWINQRKLSFLGIPRYVASGLYSPPGQPGCRFLIMDRFTGDMESVLKQARLTSDQVILIACHVLNALEYLHSKDYAHADIKASNLLYKISVVEVTLVDFGLVHLFRINGKHTAAKPNPKFKHNGTLEFCSRDAHRGFPPSPRGDLEILLFNLIHWLARCQPGTAQSFTTGLPWGYLISDPKLRENASDSVKNQVAAIKEQAMRDIDCFFTQAGIPHDTDLSSFMLTVSQLDYDQTPDYELLRQHLLAFSKRMKSSVTNSSPKVGTPARPMKRLSTEHLSHVCLLSSSICQI
ncbi:unnamed protein product [Dicrocoelium dendriticum]|nr:unnamed protein product [Dicrocoelium dendriticum]